MRVEILSSFWSCRICREKLEREYMKQDKMTPFSTPMISPTTSLSSSDRSYSSCSEFSVDVNSYERGDEEGCTSNNNQEDLSVRLNNRLQNSRLEGPVNGLDRLNKMTGGRLKDGSNGNENAVLRDVEIFQPSNGHETKVDYMENISGSSNNASKLNCSMEHEMDVQIWEPPESEDPEDDMEASVTYNDDDDDDEFGDGTKWGKPSSLSDFVDEGSVRHKFKEEKQTAMEGVRSGKFKAIVSQLLKSVGVASCEKHGENWVDIVTSLSWEAASSLKPDAIDKAMDPNLCLKVKCIATGCRSQSQVIKGLVFKKHAAHKHMPTNYKNPRLLLIRGVLDQSSNGLSSFDAMKQEKDHLKSVMEMIEICNPNVILVEKTVSRDIQESILARGMTLVLDMKLHRLERVARSTGAPIVSSETLTSQKLKHCDSFHIEKFIEEHAGFAEGGKRPSKTLMFIEGCPTRLGCTVLLKGSNSDELKKIKYVVQCAFVMACHLILETSFLVDQRSMFSTICFAEVLDVLAEDQKCAALENSNSSDHFLEDTTAETGSAIDISISNGFHEDSSSANSGLEDSVLSYEPYNPAIFSGFSSLSASLKKVIGYNFPCASAASYQSLFSYFSSRGREPTGQMKEVVPVSKVMEDSDLCDMSVKSSSDEEKLHDDLEQPPPLSTCSEAPVRNGSGNDEDQAQSKEDANAALDSQSILVLMSIRNALRGTICEQIHFSHIMFYKNFDIPLGKFLQDHLLNQRSQCPTCGELPEAHLHYYAHHNKQLTIKVKRLPDRKCLPGEVKGKIWMWSCCGKCKTTNGVIKSTKRVLISTAACSLSFGKFLELSFCHHSSSSRLSTCGHSLHRDFLHFFGLGPMVAMFRYSPVMTYAVSLPPQKLEFSNSINREWLKEFWNLHNKGMSLFTEVENSLMRIGSQFVGATLNIGGSMKEFSVILEMLKQECAAFEVDIQNAVAKNGNPDDAFHKLLSLNRIRWELLLESCVWDRRLQSLTLADPTVVITGTAEKVVHEQSKSNKDGTSVRGNERLEFNSQNSEEVPDNSGNLKLTSDISAEANEVFVKDISIDDPVVESEEREGLPKTSTVSDDIMMPTTVGSLRPNRLTNDGFAVRTNATIYNHSGDGSFQADSSPLSENLQVDGTIVNSADLVNNDSIVNSNISENSISLHSQLADLEKVNGWFWMPFSELRQIYTRDLQRGYVPKFEPVSSYTPEHLPVVHKIFTEEGSRLHIPLGIDNYMVSDYEGELSSIIACALALLKDLPVSPVVLDVDSRRESEMGVKTESLHSLTRIPTITSLQWSINGSTDSDSVHSALTISSDELRFSSFGGLNLLESLVPPETLSPEVSIGVSKSLGKGKYSVKCLYANQFHDLRSRCCPSELDYIDSLSRCRNWDAKGGKSKSVFAKTLDDRFIIKEIKKTEFDSFDKFAAHYFKYMNESFDQGNQTCLAKVLGIYQVTVRQTKSGKEMRHDLMVMENLTFGRNIIRKYDLKGALHARYNSVVDGSGDVLLDQNFVNDMNSSPLYVSNKAKRILTRAVWNDTTFLNSIDVMDYSLLVGVDNQRQELVCGIIDYLRQYTWDKHLETWVKSSLVPKNVLPTVISPKEYKKRFRKFMSIHFLCVPDHWCSQESSDSCELCGIKDDNSSL